MAETETCDKCGREKQMYYEPICFYCEKPEPQKIQEWNFLKLMYYMEKKTGRIFKDIVWDHLAYLEVIRGNDMWFSAHYLKPSNEPWDDQSEEVVDLLTLLNKEFDIDKNDLVLISW